MKKYIKTVSLLMLLSLYFGADAQQYKLQDADVIMKGNRIIGLTEQGNENVKGTHLIIPEMLQGQTVRVIDAHNNHSFRYQNLKGVELPPTVEFIGHGEFEHNDNFILPDMNKLKNLRHVGFLSFYGWGSNKQADDTTILNFSNNSNLEYFEIGAMSSLSVPIKKIDFSNCISLKYIAALAFTNECSKNFLEEIDFSNCYNLSSISFLVFNRVPFTDTTVENPAKINFSNCNSLIYIGAGITVSGKNNMDYVYNSLPIPKINGLTFVSWGKYEVYSFGDVICGSFIAKFKEVVISVDVQEAKMSIWGGSGSRGNKGFKKTLLQSVKQGQNDNKTVSFEIRNHSVQQVNISAIKTTNGGTLSWQKGTIKTGETQKVVVTYPKGTTDYSNTISIEGPDLKGNTTVKISKTGETTTDNNMLSSVAQEQLAREQNKLLSVYPNPALSELHISYSKPQESYRLKIISLQGKTMYQNNRFQGTSVNVEHLPPAIYLIQVNESVKTFIKH